MSLTESARLGPYEVTGTIGAGGMGEVYRARDVRLSRDVALKILPSLFASDKERLARFEREAKTLASLNHPNIAAIYGVEEQAGIRALAPPRCQCVCRGRHPEVPAQARRPVGLRRGPDHR